MGLLLLAFGLFLAVSGCGKKPGHVDPPPGATGTFPRTYPDPATDPGPQP
jgi:hypothetical protein